MYQAATYSMNDEHKKATTAFLQALEYATPPNIRENFYKEVSIKRR